MGTLHDFAAERARRPLYANMHSKAVRKQTAQIHIFPGVYQMRKGVACTQRIGVIRVVERHSKYEQD